MRATIPRSTGRPAIASTRMRSLLGGPRKPRPIGRRCEMRRRKSWSRPRGLEQLVRLVGAQALPDRQRWILDAARFLKEGFLQQNALHPVDAYCVPAKQVALLRLFVELYQSGQQVIESGATLARVRQLLDVRRLVQMKETVPNDQVDQIAHMLDELKAALNALAPRRGKSDARVCRCGSYRRPARGGRRLRESSLWRTG